MVAPPSCNLLQHLMSLTEEKRKEFLKEFIIAEEATRQLSMGN
jgi:hypothetical protein